MQGPRARGSLHGRVRTGDDRHRAVRRRRAAGDDVPRRLRLREGLRPDQPRSGTAGGRRGRRSALQSPTCSAHSATRARPAQEDEPDAGRTRPAWSRSSTSLPDPIGDDLRERRDACARLRAGAGAVRGRVPGHPDAKGGPVPRRARTGGADRALSLPAGSGDRPLSARADFPGRASARSARRSASCRGPTSSWSMHPEDARRREAGGGRRASGSSTTWAKCGARCRSNRPSGPAPWCCQRGCGGGARHQRRTGTALAPDAHPTSARAPASTTRACRWRRCRTRLNS